VTEVPNHHKVIAAASQALVHWHTRQRTDGEEGSPNLPDLDCTCSNDSTSGSREQHDLDNSGKRLETPSSAAYATVSARHPSKSSNRSIVLRRSGSKASPVRPACNLRPLWATDDGEDGPERCQLLIGTKENSSGLLQCNPKAAVLHDNGSCLQKLVVSPNSRPRIAWDMLSVAVLSYDILSVPMVAFTMDKEDSPEQKLLELITTIFWTLDIPISFLSGFHNDGILDVRPRSIAKRYLRGWFMLDFPIVFLDWCVSTLLSGHLHQVVGVARFSKIVRIIRVLRVFRLLRVLKLPGWADSFRDCLRSEGTVTALGIFRSLLIIAVASHFIACAWYFIGGMERPQTWVQVLDDEERDLAYRYSTALHWSVTQFTPASMEIVPKNTTERIFAIVVILSAMVAFSCFVSSITQAMASLQRSQLERDRQQNNMRRYIAENNISLELGNQISSFVRTYKVMAKRRVHEQDVQIFKLLPESLRQELRWEVHIPVLMQHPLFKMAYEIEDSFLHEVCHAAMFEVSLGRSEELFHFEQEAKFVYFLKAGTWQYIRQRKAISGRKATLNMSSPSSDNLMTLGEEEPEPLEINGTRCVCEAALWLEWTLQGAMVAVTPCESTSLNVQKFQQLAGRRRCDGIFMALREYATRYREKLQNAEDWTVAELGFDAADLDEMVCDSERCELPMSKQVSKKSSQRSGRKASRRYFHDSSEGGSVLAKMFGHTVSLRSRDAV
jgi:CRP-like cAMP-binding protein